MLQTHNEINIMSGCVDHSPKCHAECHLLMTTSKFRLGLKSLTRHIQPDVLICGEQPCELGPNDADHISKHRDEDQPPSVRKNQTSSSGSPNGELQSVEAGQLCISGLPIQEKKKWEASLSAHL